MPPRNRRARFARHSVTAVIVSHDGARWLADCLAALAGQTRPPQRVVAVDTGSGDDSVELLTATLGASAVLARPRRTAFGDAVQAGLDAFAGAPAPPGVEAGATEWLWVLHDDCAPEPEALDRLLERVEDSPSVSVVGPKVLSWDRRSLVEVGVTIDTSGRRETGLEHREVDQGQHDAVGDVLAVGTAGMLVRRDVWDRIGGLDPSFALAAEDVDFGWRVNAAGGRVVVAPQAVVRHAAALTAGARAADAVGVTAGAAQRGHGMQVVLANTSRWLVVPLAVRLALESLLRALLSLLVLRSPRRARDEVLGLAMLVASPRRLLVARRVRRRARERAHRELRGLLAPPGWRLRRVGDALAGAVAGRRAVDERQRRRAPVETGPVAAEAESFAVDDLGVLARWLTRPGFLLVVVLTALALVADRSLLGGTLHGGRLLPAPAGAADLWSTYLSGWHPVDLGSSISVPPVTGLLALIASVCLGKPWLAVDIVMLAAAPLAGLTAYLASGAVTRRLPVRVWTAVAYAVVPALIGAVAGGRIDVVLAVILLPVTARATAAAVRRPAAHRSVGAGLLLALLTSAAPVLWIAAGAALLLCLAVTTAGPGGLAVRRWLAAVGVVAVVPLVLLPFTVRVLGDATALVTGAGLPETFASRRGVPVADLVLLHPGGPAGSPLWVWAPLVAGALAAVVTRRQAARVGVVVLLSGVTGALVISRLTPSTEVEAGRYWSGALLALAAVGALAAVATGADAAPRALRRAAFGWRQPAVALLAVATAAGTVVAGAGWLARGSARPLTDSSANLLPPFAQAEAAAATTPRTLVLRADGATVSYALLRTPGGLRLGDADVAPSPRLPGPARRALAAAIADAAGGQARAARELAAFGVVLVVVPDDKSATLRRLAAVDGLARVPATSTVVYRSAVPAGELVVLHGTDATGALGRSGAVGISTARPLEATAGSAHVRLPGSTDGGRLLVLAESRSSRWQATLDGHRLAAATAYGWAQAWRLPATGGVLHVHRVTGPREVLLALQLVALIVALGLSLPVGALRSRTELR